MPANILGVSNVLDACRRAGVKNVVVASSGKVHAGHTGAYPITLTTPTSVVCSYGATKLFAEGAAQAYAHGVPDATVTVIRFAWCPRTPTDLAAMRVATEPGQGTAEYLSPADAASCVQSALSKREAGYALVFCQSIPPPGRHPRFDLEPAGKILSWRARDCFPNSGGSCFPGGIDRNALIDDMVADDYTPNPALYPRSDGEPGLTSEIRQAELRDDPPRSDEPWPEVIVAPSSDFTEIVSTQTTGGEVWDAARKLLDYLVADGLAGAISVLELGAGCGWLGMSLAQALPHLELVVLTELVDGGALDWLDHNLEINRNAGSCAPSVRMKALDWNCFVDGTLDVDASAHRGFLAGRGYWASPKWRDRPFDVVIGSDLVYDHAGAAALVRVLQHFP